MEIAYELEGDGPPLVLVHAAGTDSRMWQPQVDALADEFTVLAWDEPGAGRSSDLPVNFQLADFADCLAAVIEASSAQPAWIAGISWGGTVVLELYRRRPELASGLILMDTYAGWKGSLPEAEVRARVEGAEAALSAPPGEFDPSVPGLFAGQPPPDVAELIREMDDDVRPASMRAALSAMANADQRDLMPEVRVPVLLIWGELDERSPLEVARQFESAIPDSELIVIPDVGHLSNLERPHPVNQAIREFCRAHRSPEGA
jgi:pimeloyl-ACP methyl ester carboxylesterase